MDVSETMRELGMSQNEIQQLENSHRNVIHGDSAATEQTDVEDEATVQLADLGAGIRDQDDLERDIGRQANRLLNEQAIGRDQKRLEKTLKDKERLLRQVQRLEQKLTEFGNHATKNKYRAEIETCNAQIAVLEKDVQQIEGRLTEREHNQESRDSNSETISTNKRLPGESHRGFLIRTGKITPFSKVGSLLRTVSSNLEDVLLDAEEDEENDEDNEKLIGQVGSNSRSGPVSHRDLLVPGFRGNTVATPSTTDDTDGDAELARRLQEEEFASERPAKRRQLQRKQIYTRVSEESDTMADDLDAYRPDGDKDRHTTHALSEDSMEFDDDEMDLSTTPGKRRRQGRKARRDKVNDSDHEDLAGIDDGNEDVFQARLRSWTRRRRAARNLAREHNNGAFSEDTSDHPQSPDIEQQEDAADEWILPHPGRPDVELDGGLRIPGDIYPLLFDYQKTGVQWLWELYSQQVGGIIGDEMGLGKTIQVISFIAALHHSGKLTKPAIIVCPATVMKQWVNEFHRWWPPLRVSILHSSGSGMLDTRRESRFEDDLETRSYIRQTTQKKGHNAAKHVVDRVVNHGHVLVTTYSGLQTYANLLIPTDWGYAVLDEGHKIRNPNTGITIYCKELRTHNRIILSGTPMQNNLTELWSLFDFIFPMRLGTLVNFRNQFEIPIKTGGYANASNLQVETAMKCAETLKDTIGPYLLQRFKVDVAADLPKKSERVLFCKLTKLQLEAYEWFLGSEDMKSIMTGKRQALYGVDILRKICNHPDLVEHKTLSKKAGYSYGDSHKSGKMQVVKALLEIWKKNGHKTLLFAQHRIMLDILEDFVRRLGSLNYRRMDGNTSIKDRQDLVDEFNRDPDLHVFLLTTKVGGLGVNLTGADRVIIYDPDWNPSTDVQARERAWRLGQKREVEIYRLMTAGTIEEKIYHRQIFKQFLTNKILRDPKQRQTFQLRDLHDLFTLGDMRKDGQTETASIFAGSEVLLSGGRAGPSKKMNTDGVREISGVSREEEYQGEQDEEQGNSANGTSKDDRVLSSIFARSGVHSALEHDAIINGRKVVRADPEMIAREARRVAAEAARELQRAGDIARTIPAGEVTWTGQFGTAGRPNEDLPVPRRGGMFGSRGGRGGPSSASVLANLQSRGAVSSASRSADSSGTETNLKGKDFAVLIQKYLMAQGGSAYTQMLIDHFNRFCRSEQSTAEFKEILKTMAVLEKGGRGRGKWVLKGEYRPTTA